METVVTPNSWTELIEALYDQTWFEPLQRFRSSHAFRGLPNINYDLKTSLLRLAGSSETARALEVHMLRSFQKFAHGEAAADDSVWNWLALAQHRGLPTRLLDWTWSPFVALHFATDRLEHFDVDGVVWCLDCIKARDLLPRRLHEIIAKEGSILFTVDMLKQAAGKLKDFDELDSSCFVIFFEPPSLDARIVNQYAAFTLMNDAGAQLDTWLASHPDLYRKIIIPAKLKWEVRDKIDQANVTERMLFPGLDGLTRWLTRYYTPKHLSTEVLKSAATVGAGRGSR